MIEKVKYMNGFELENFLYKVQNSMLENKERNELYDAIHSRMNELNTATLEAVQSELTFEDIEME